MAPCGFGGIAAHGYPCAAIHDKFSTIPFFRINETTFFASSGAGLFL
jgi:hypothetical protein